MLLYLHLKNYILIKEIELSFKEGFICFTGETGAGKSMILESLLLLKGERVDWSIFEGLKEVYVEGIFKFEPDKEIFDKYEIPVEEEISVQRILYPEEKVSKIRVNGVPVSLSILKEIFDKIIEIHGQSSQFYFLNKRNYLDIIDRYSFITEESEKFEKLFNSYKKSLKEYNELQKDFERILTMKDFMEHSIKEMKEIDIENINVSEIFDEYRKLNERKELNEKINEILNELGEGEDSVIKKIGRILKNENLFKELGKRGFELLKEIDNLLGEAIDEFVKIRFEEEEEEKRLLELENLLQKIEDLKRKHRTDEEGLLFLYKKWKKELENFEILKNKIKEMEKNLKDMEKNLEERANMLSKERKRKAKEFEKEVEKILLNLGFPYVKFEVKFYERDLYERGKDEVEFLISTSKDKSPFPLSRVASGGELSRIMLAIKTLISEKESSKILLFDEVDTGIGGEVARIVGKNLKTLAKGKQVFCITHLPQIASFSDCHFYVYKDVKNGKTIIKVKELKSIEERKREIARMIAGKEIDETSLNAAEKLLSEGIK
ncbi:MAG: AAA family ATPase [candidate division WOR-3 bacterium]